MLAITPPALLSGATPRPRFAQRLGAALRRRALGFADLFRPDPIGAELQRQVRRMTDVMDAQAPGSISRMRAGAKLNAMTSHRDAHYARRRGDREMAALHETEAEQFERAARNFTGWERSR